MENIGLTDIIRNELNKVFSDAKTAYFVNSGLDEAANHARLDTFLVDESPKRENIKSIKKTQSGLLKANSEYQQLTTGGSLEFTLENINSLKKTYQLLERSLPEVETTHELSEFVFNHVDRTSYAKLYGVVKKFMWDSTAMALIGAGASYYTESYTALALYGTAAACSISSLISKKDSVLRSFVANAGIALGSTALSYTYPHKIDKTMDNIILGSSFIFQIPALVLMSKTVNYALAKNHYRKKANHMKNTKPSFDNFLKGGVALEEAERSLGYIQRFCKLNQKNASDFQEEVNKLEITLLNYYNGNASFVDIEIAGNEIKTKVKYLLSIKPQKEMGGNGYTQVSRTKFSGYSQAEREKEKRLRKGSLNTFVYETVINETITEENNKEEFDIQPSQKIMSYDSKFCKMGHPMTYLRDMTKSKIKGLVESDSMHEPISRTGSGTKLIANLRKEHGFSEGTTVYRITPIGNNLRSFYIRDGNKITMLDVLTHPEYERMMK